MKGDAIGALDALVVAGLAILLGFGELCDDGDT
jgi:hypothetical protein